jgi:enoyl-CoA hydratase
MSTPPARLTFAGPVARVVLDKPPVNAFDIEMVETLSGLVLELAASDARAAIFCGAGRSLAAGGDIKWMLSRAEAGDAGALRGFFRAIQRLFDDVERLPMPTVAVVHGPTLGGGFELALACDLRVAARDARMGCPESTLGLLPGAGGTQRLREILGRGVALELLYTGRAVDAQDAYRLGLVNRLADPGDLDGVVDELVADVLRSTPAAATAIKACVQAGLLHGRGAGLTTEGERIEALAFDPETNERLVEFSARSSRKAAPAPA